MTTATMTAHRAGSAVPAPRPRVRHGILAAALATVALLRAGQGDWWWAALLAAGAAAELAVLVLARRPATTAGATAPPAPAPRPGQATLLRSLEGHRRASRTWTAVTALALATAAALVVGDPALAAVVAVVGVVALVLRRRSRRTCARLERLLGTAGNGVP